MIRTHIKRNINLLRNIKTIIYYKSHLHLFSENDDSDLNYFYVIIGDKMGDVLILLIFLYSHANKLKPIWGLLYRSRRKVFLILLCKLKINYSYKPRNSWSDKISVTLLQLSYFYVIYSFLWFNLCMGEIYEEVCIDNEILSFLKT